MIVDSCWLLPLLLLGLAGVSWATRCRQQSARDATVVHRLLKPRSSDDCPTCRQQAGIPTRDAPARPPLRPWRELKSRRGAPKRIDTHGFACPMPTCRYYHITDAQVHALVGDGAHGKPERIQTFRCQACRTTFSARRHTPLAPLENPSPAGG
jgi:hypothetical protein